MTRTVLDVRMCVCAYVRVRVCVCVTVINVYIDSMRNIDSTRNIDMHAWGMNTLL
jgi:hypothetical protein